MFSRAGPSWPELALTVTGASAILTVFIYMAPVLRSETHASTWFVSVILVLSGIGLTVGNLLGGSLICLLRLCREWCLQRC